MIASENFHLSLLEKAVLRILPKLSLKLFWAIDTQAIAPHQNDVYDVLIELLQLFSRILPKQRFWQQRRKPVGIKRRIDSRIELDCLRIRPPRANQLDQAGWRSRPRRQDTGANRRRGLVREVLPYLCHQVDHREPDPSDRQEIQQADEQKKLKPSN